VIDLGSIAGLYEHDHELHAYCPTCDRWAVLDLGETMIRCGQAQRSGPLRHAPVGFARTPRI